MNLTNIKNKGDNDSTWAQEIEIAIELCYPKSVIERLRNEPNPIKRSNILKKARENM